MISMRGHRLLVRADVVEEKSEGGIVIPMDERKERTAVQRGVVVDVGSQCWKAFREVDEDGAEHNGEPWAKVGDYVFFARHAGKFIKDPVTKEEFLVLNDEDILGVIYDEENPEVKSDLQDRVGKIRAGE